MPVAPKEMRKGLREAYVSGLSRALPEWAAEALVPDPLSDPMGGLYGATLMPGASPAVKAAFDFLAKRYPRQMGKVGRVYTARNLPKKGPKWTGISLPVTAAGRKGRSDVWVVRPESFTRSDPTGKAVETMAHEMRHILQAAKPARRAKYFDPAERLRAFMGGKVAHESILEKEARKVGETAWLRYLKSLD